MSGIVLATGDIAPDRDDPDECFSATRDLLNGADIVFGQLETSFADVGTRLPQARHAVLTRPAAAGALARAGFDVISCAGNHCLDWGNDALLQTIGNLQQHGVDVVGAGRNIQAARKPVIKVTQDGTRVAFLAYCSILPMSYWAEENRPGCAPMRAHTHYEPVEADQPGTMARIHTYPHRDDLAAMREDIAKAKQQADVVLVSQHWGIHFVRASIATYQRDVARAAIEAGADAVLGHHAHILKGVEFIESKPVFYSLCNFATDLRMDPEHAKRKSFKEIQILAEKWEPDFDSLYNFPEASRLSMIARLDIAEGRIQECSAIPLFIDRDAVPRAQSPSDAHFQEVMDYLRAVSAEAGLDADFQPEGDRIVLRPRAT
jgi:poly-gamma-glutamate capsule biosynthesis protein CapA/YwtB (metallophosphatase superfamily)